MSQKDKPIRKCMSVKKTALAFAKCGFFIKILKQVQDDGSTFY